MSDRWVIPSLFKVQAVSFDWNDEAGRLGVQGPLLNTGTDPGFVHLRWMLHPGLGMPPFPFTIWHMSHPGGNPSAQDLANMNGWEAIEIVGLPVDDSWSDTRYSVGRQGPVDNPMPPMEGTLPPFEAAFRRLQFGAPRFGWVSLMLNGIPMEDWRSPDIQIYLEDLMRSPLFLSVRSMLLNSSSALDDDRYIVHVEETANQEQLQPHLILNDAAPLSRPNQQVHGEWGPLGLLLLSAGTDPLAALALGFGASLITSSEDLYMVTVQHRLTIGDTDFDFELADVVGVNGSLPAPDPPGGLQAHLTGGSRPQVVDGPALQSIGVSWDRRENPLHTIQPQEPFPVSYVVGRFGPHPVHAEILLAKRKLIEGADWMWLPFIASKPDEIHPVVFADHILRLSNIGGQPFADPNSMQLTYVVAAQDIFGRWSAWNTIPFQQAGEPPQTPSILSVNVDLSGKYDVDFAWDWSERSPEFIEIIGAYRDAPGNLLFSTRVQFDGAAEPQANGVIPLNSERQPAAGWGQAQDPNPTHPEVRFYRLSGQIMLDFAGQPERVFQVQTRGQSNLHHIWGAAVHHPDFNISPFSQAVSTRLFDPTPPRPPEVPEAPQWASLPDGMGVSRFRLRWRTDSGVDGYMLYEATETSLLAALGLPGPDTSQPYTLRLATLRAANLPALRNEFRRVQKELIAPTSSETSYEVTLPRGSRVIHVYALTAMSHNQVESAWPDSSRKFIAVAAPHVVIPPPPTLQADLDLSQPAVQLRIGVRGLPDVSHVEVFRSHSEELARNVDTMGPPLVSLPASGAEITFIDQTIPPGWQRHWYRAVAWFDQDDQRGLVETRSAASSPVPVILPPQTPPDISDMRSGEPGSGAAEDLTSWTSRAPTQTTLLGPHTVIVETHDTAGNLIVRLEENLDTLPAFDGLANVPPPDPANRRIARVGAPNNYRLYVWLPRPVDLFFSVTIKMIDPLGRINARTEDVIPIAVLLVTVPDLIGSDLQGALQKLSSLGLVPVVGEVLLADPEHPVVEALNPPVGTSLETGNQISVTPGDRPLIEVPDVRNKSLTEAKQVLEAVGLVPEEALVALADFSTAIVHSTEPPQGTLIRAGTTVVIVLMDSL